MPLAETTGWPTWLAATSISLLVWWTIASPIAVLGVAVLTARRPRTGHALLLAVCVPPLLVLLPLTVMRGGAGAVAAGAAAAFEIVAVLLSLAALVTYRRPAITAGDGGDEAAADAGPTPRHVKLGWAAAFSAVAGGMVGSLAFLTLFS
jgi:hypothetical protein